MTWLAADRAHVQRLEENYAKDPSKHLILLVETYLAAGRPKDAERILKKRRDSSAESKVLWAQVRFDLGHPKNAEELLRIREARVLRVPIVVRIVFSLFGLGSAFAYAMPVAGRLVVCVVAGGTIAANLYFLRLLRDVRKVDLVGYTGVAIDILSLSFELTIGGPITEWFTVFGALLYVAFISFNTLQLRKRPEGSDAQTS